MSKLITCQVIFHRTNGRFFASIQFYPLTAALIDFVRCKRKGKEEVITASLTLTRKDHLRARGESVDYFFLANTLSVPIEVFFGDCLAEGGGRVND